MDDKITPKQVLVLIVMGVLTVAVLAYSLAQAYQPTIDIAKQIATDYEQSEGVQ